MSGLAVGGAAMLIAATVVPAPERTADAGSPPTVITAASRACEVPPEFTARQAPREAPVEPLEAAAASPTGRGRAVGNRRDARSTTRSTLGRYRYKSPDNVRFLVRAVTEDGRPLQPFLDQRSMERAALTVHVVDHESDLDDSWIDTREYAATRASYLPEGIDRYERRGDDAALCHLYLGGHESVRLALVVNDAVLSAMTARPSQDTVTFVVKRSRLDAWIGRSEILVVEAGTRRPIVGADVVLNLGGMNVHREIADQVTDRYGRVRASHMPANLEARATAEGYHEGRATLQVHGGGQLATATVALFPKVKATGRVLDEEGAPVGVTVYARARTLVRTPGDDSDEHLRTWESVTSDTRTGEFTFEALRPGTYELYFFPLATRRDDEPGWRSRRVDTRNGPVKDIELTWSPEPHGEVMISRCTLGSAP